MVFHDSELNTDYITLARFLDDSKSLSLKDALCIVIQISKIVAEEYHMQHLILGSLRLQDIQIHYKSHLPLYLNTKTAGIIRIIKSGFGDSEFESNIYNIFSGPEILTLNVRDIQSVYTEYFDVYSIAMLLVFLLNEDIQAIYYGETDSLRYIIEYPESKSIYPFKSASENELAIISKINVVLSKALATNPYERGDVFDLYDSLYQIYRELEY